MSSSATDEILTAKFVEAQKAVTKKDLASASDAFDELYQLLVHERDPESWQAYCSANDKVETVLVKSLGLLGCNSARSDALELKLVGSLSGFLSAGDISDATFVTARVLRALFHAVHSSNCAVHTRILLTGILVEDACAKEGKIALLCLVEKDFDFRDALADFFGGLAFCDNVAVQVCVMEFAWRLIRFAEKARRHTVKKAITAALPEPLDTKVLTILQEDFMNDARAALMPFNKEAADFGRGNPNLCHFECDKIYAQSDDKTEHEISCEEAFLDIGSGAIGLAFAPDPELASSSPRRASPDLEKENLVTQTYVVAFSSISKVVAVPCVQSIKLFVDPSGIDRIFNEVPRLPRPPAGRPLVFRCVIEGDTSTTQACASRLQEVVKDSDVRFEETSGPTKEKVHVAVMDLATPPRVPETSAFDCIEDQPLNHKRQSGTRALADKEAQSPPGQPRVSVASMLFVIPSEEDTRAPHGEQQASPERPGRTEKSARPGKQAASAADARPSEQGTAKKGLRRRTYGTKKVDAPAGDPKDARACPGSHSFDPFDDFPATQAKEDEAKTYVARKTRPIRAKQLRKGGQRSGPQPSTAASKPRRPAPADTFEVMESPKRDRSLGRSLSVSARKRSSKSSKTTSPRKRQRTAAKKAASTTSASAAQECTSDDHHVMRKAVSSKRAASGGIGRQQQAFTTRSHQSESTTDRKAYGGRRKEASSPAWKIFGDDARSVATPKTTYQSRSRRDASRRSAASKATETELNASPIPWKRQEEKPKAKAPVASTKVAANTKEAGSGSEAKSLLTRRSVPKARAAVATPKKQEQKSTADKETADASKPEVTKKSYPRRTLTSKKPSVDSVAKRAREPQEEETCVEQKKAKSSAAIRRRLQLRSAKKASKETNPTSNASTRRDISTRRDTSSRRSEQTKGEPAAKAKGRRVIALSAEALRPAKRTPDDRVSQVTTPSTRRSRSHGGRHTLRTNFEDRGSPGESDVLGQISSPAEVAVAPKPKSKPLPAEDVVASSSNAGESSKSSPSVFSLSGNEPSPPDGSSDKAHLNAILAKTPRVNAGYDAILTDSAPSEDRFFGNLTPDLVAKRKKRSTITKIPSLTLAKIKSPPRGSNGGSKGLDQLLLAMTKSSQSTSIESVIAKASSNVDLEGGDDDGLVQMLLLQILDAKRKKKIRKRRKQLARAQQSVVMDVEDKLATWEESVEKQLRAVIKGKIMKRLSEIDGQIDGLRDRFLAEKEQQDNERKSIRERIRRHSTALKKAMRDVNVFISECGEAKRDFARDVGEIGQKKP